MGPLFVNDRLKEPPQLVLQHSYFPYCGVLLYAAVTHAQSALKTMHPSELRKQYQVTVCAYSKSYLPL